MIPIIVFIMVMMAIEIAIYLALPWLASLMAATGLLLNLYYEPIASLKKKWLGLLGLAIFSMAWPISITSPGYSGLMVCFAGVLISNVDIWLVIRAKERAKREVMDSAINEAVQQHLNGPPITVETGETEFGLYRIAQPFSKDTEGLRDAGKERPD